mmetsp:Transcript_1199/g.1897  ORF Transcript_1199/g.1897 Transcript_1199/m.1897 type:complete len:164 (-) Transcript_1199:283-774(-)
MLIGARRAHSAEHEGVETSRHTFWSRAVKLGLQAGGDPRPMRRPVADRPRYMARDEKVRRKPSRACGPADHEAIDMECSLTRKSCCIELARWASKLTMKASSLIILLGTLGRVVVELAVLGRAERNGVDCLFTSNGHPTGPVRPRAVHEVDEEASAWCRPYGS